MKDFFAENFGNFWKKSFVLRKISGLLFSKNNVDPHPPPPPSPTFSGKIFAFRKKFLGGPWNGRGPNFGIHPPQPIFTTHDKTSKMEFIIVLTEFSPSTILHYLTVLRVRKCFHLEENKYD
jgi:hypothetical protein